ncbi:CHASE3 domain-containing protein [Massilia sp. DWR3-1-1]|uniref:CHASE3 domain-containing protein n=1 Tax=Massilia sp. DWR3-1-1 TaxID=2804559 RepID=UPI003CEF25DC
MVFSIESPSKPPLPFYKTVLCVLCVLILIVNGFSLARNLESLNDAKVLQSQGARVVDRVQALNVLVTDAESNLRGYFLSGIDSYLRQVVRARGEADRQFAQLRGLLADNPNQLKNLAQLQNLVRRDFAGMDDMLRVYRVGGLNDVAKIAHSLGDDGTVDEIRLMVVIIAQEQRELLATRSAAYNRDYRNAVMLGIGINLGAILVVLLFYRLIRQSFFSGVQAQQALETANQTLESTVALRTEQLSVLSRHLISVAEEEKSRLARELHDEMGANLTAISIDLNAVSERLRTQQPQLARMLERARATLVDTVQLKRRIVENLRPSLLDNLGLSAAVQSYCAEFGQLTTIDCEALVERTVDAAGPMHAIAVFRIVQEALNNVAKYARASTVIVHLAVERDCLVLEISDNGVGIDTDAALAPKSHGLLGMRERALLLGGNFTVRRGVNDCGTCIEASIPLATAAASHGVEVAATTTPAAPALLDHVQHAKPAAPAPPSISEPRRPAGDRIPT